MKNQKLRKTVFAALFAAIICVATIVVRIPSPATNGFFNLGDCFVIIAGQLLGVGFGAWAAGIGCLLYTSPSPRDPKTSRMPSSA